MFEKRGDVVSPQLHRVVLLRLGRLSDAAQVHGDDLIALGEDRCYAREECMRRSKARNQNDRLALAAHLVEQSRPVDIGKSHSPPAFQEKGPPRRERAAMDVALTSAQVSRRVRLFTYMN